VNAKGDSYSLVDLNRAGVPLLEIVSEPDMHSIEEAKAYAMAIHRILRYIEVSSCDMEKGAIRFEANISIRPVGSDVLNTRTEIKNLNSFRALERSLAYEIQRQIQVVEGGGRVIQETVGWNDLEGVTFSQRSKEEAHDYRYFPEPDLPPLVIEPEWLAEIKAGMVELPDAKQERFIRQYGLSEYDARLLVEDKAVAAYFEQVVAVDAKVSPKSAANWINGEWISCLNQSGKSVAEVKVTPQSLAELTLRVAEGKINLNTAKQVFGEMFKTGKSADEIIREKGLVQITDNNLISELIAGVIKDHPEEVASYLAGKETLANWFFGQVMARAKGQASPAVIRAELEQQLARLKTV
jgi:aspartyl-tRNA(Asn)/glutamyl-tRNA(Gln) amidotransferase subunit B